MENKKIIERLDKIANTLYEKFGTESYEQRCELFDIKEALKISREKETEQKIYSYKGKHYKILHYSTYKERPSGSWIPAIVYQAVDGNEIYCRCSVDFAERFTKVE